MGGPVTDYPSLKSLGWLVARKRGKVGIRATAREIGLSPATLSRVENGHMPDLANFTKICRWLEVDPARVLGFEPETLGRPVAAVHFRSQTTVSLSTAGALQELIVMSQRVLAGDDGDQEGGDGSGGGGGGDGTDPGRQGTDIGDTSDA